MTLTRIGNSISILLVFLCLSCSIADPTEATLSNISASLVSTIPDTSADQASEIGIAIDRNLRTKNFLSSIQPYLRNDEIETPIIKWNYSDNLRILQGDNFAIALERTPCNATSLAARVECFLVLYPDVFGILPQFGDLIHLKTTMLRNGYSIVRLQQQIEEYPVRGMDITVAVDSRGDITSIYSHYIKGLKLSLYPYSDLETVFSSVDAGNLLNAVQDYTGKTGISLLRRQNAIWVDRKNSSLVGIPAAFVTVSDASGTNYDAVVDLVYLRPISVSKSNREYPAKHIDQTGVAFPEMTTVSCPCTGEYSDFTCSNFMEPDKCVDTCQESDCNTAYGWSCWTEGTFPGHCYRSPGQGLLTVFNGTSWVQNAYSYYRSYYNLKTIMDQVVAFHYDDLGRDSWNNGDSNYLTILSSCCSDVSCAGGYAADCNWAAEADGHGTVWYYYWHQLDQETFSSEVSRNNTLSHEWAHNITHSEVGGWYTEDPCLTESIANIFSALFSVDQLGGSSEQYQGTCNGVLMTSSPWGDHTSGLGMQACNLWMPYAQRSRLDYLDCDGNYVGGDCQSGDDCQPYEVCDIGHCKNLADSHRNQSIWRRFVRVLAEGPSTFGNDDNDEDVGVTFTAIGLAATIDIVYQAVEASSSTSDTEDWVDLLLAAGIANGKSSQVRNALGVVGFLSVTGAPTAAETNKAPYRYYFENYTGSTSRNFYVWKERSTYDIKVFYANSGVWNTDTISANTDAAPTVVAFNSKLYIFWRDRSNGYIKFVYYDSTGARSGYYSLGSIGLIANGSFDSAVFNGYLYLVYSLGTYNTVTVSKCIASICNTGGWYDYNSDPNAVLYTHSLGYTAFSGMGADAVDNLNGTGENSSLYIASSSNQGGGNAYRIRIDQMNTADQVTHTTWMPNSYPSYKTYYEIGVKAIQSAFPGFGNYLHIAWKDYAEAAIYHSVVQYYDDDDDVNTWITRPADTFIDSYNGVRLEKGTPASTNTITFAHNNTGYDIEYSHLYGRY